MSSRKIRPLIRRVHQIESSLRLISELPTSSILERIFCLFSRFIFRAIGFLLNSTKRRIDGYSDSDRCWAAERLKHSLISRFHIRYDLPRHCIHWKRVNRTQDQELGTTNESGSWRLRLVRNDAASVVVVVVTVGRSLRWLDVWLVGR